MSMNCCPECGDIYDTDEQMHSINGECVCDRCWGKIQDENEPVKSLDSWQ